MRCVVFIFLLFTFVFQTVVNASLIEDYGKLPDKSMVVISPNAERIAYRDTSNNQDIMVVLDLATKKLVSAVDISSVKPNNAYFIDNDRLVFVVSNYKRFLAYQGRQEVSAAFTFNVKTKRIRQVLMAGYGIHKGQTHLGRIVGLSENKKYAYMPAYKNAGSYNLYKVNLTVKKKPRIISKGTYDTVDFFVDEQGEVLARERFDNAKNIHQVESYIDGKWRKIFKENTEIRTKSFSGVTPDKKSLVMMSQDSEHGRWAYYTMSLEDGSVSAPIFSYADKDVENLLTDINRVVHGVKYSGFKPTYEFFDEKLNARIRGINKAVPNHSFTLTDYTPDWTSMVFYMDGEQSAGNYVFYQKGQLQLLAAARPNISVDNIHPTKVYEFAARDGLTIPSLLTTPKGKEAKNLPAIMLPHGGPESYDDLSFDWLAQYFASKGFAVIKPQFRGSKGFGPAHLLKGRGEWGRKMQDDLTDAVHDLANQGVIDKERVCIVGASYGGYAALAGAAFTPDVYRCAVSINGVADIELMMDQERMDYGSDHWVVAYWDRVIANGTVKEDHLENISPVNSAAAVNIPVLLIHGEFDKVVSVEQSESMYKALKSENKNVTFVELEKGDHNLSNNKNRVKALTTVSAFIQKNMP